MNAKEYKFKANNYICICQLLFDNKHLQKPLPACGNHPQIRCPTLWKG